VTTMKQALQFMAASFVLSVVFAAGATRWGYKLAPGLFRTGPPIYVEKKVYVLAESNAPAAAHEVMAFQINPHNWCAFTNSSDKVIEGQLFIDGLTATKYTH